MFIIFFFPQKSPPCLVNVSYFRFREHFNKLLICKSSYEEPFLVRGKHKNDWKGPNIDIKRNDFLINDNRALNIEIWRKKNYYYFTTFTFTTISQMWKMKRKIYFLFINHIKNSNNPFNRLLLILNLPRLSQWIHG